MITPKDRAKFMNFGLSRFTAGGAGRLQRRPRRTSHPKSSPAGPADARSDIYSLGAVMFEMLTGRQRARGLVLTGLNANVPPELEQIIGRMLAANVEHRAQSAATIAAEFRSVAAILDLRTEAAEAAEAAEPRRGAASSGAGGVVAIVIVMLVLAAAIAAWWMQMIVETRAVPPFQKNGYVVACETTREAVVIDPGDEVDMLLDVVAAPVADGAEHPADACARRSRNGGVAREAGAAGSCVPASRRSVSLRRGSPAGGLLRTALRRAAADRWLLRSVGDAVVRRIRSRRPSHTGTLSRRRLSGDRQQGGRRKRICSSAIRCSPARSAGPIFPVAITRP